MKSKASITDRGTSWEILQSWWIALSFVALSWIGFFYIAIQAKQKKWKKMALIFCILQVGLFFIIGIQKNNNLTNFAVVIWLIAYIAGIVVSFIVRKEYLIRLDVLLKTDVNDEEIQDLKDKIVSEYQSEGIIDEPVQKYHHVGLNKKDQEEVDQAGKVVDQPKLDINSCSELDFINLPGFNTLMAKEAEVYRKTHHGFDMLPFR